MGEQDVVAAPSAQVAPDHLAYQSPPLLESSFRHFAPLLAASQAYAHQTGCRFTYSTFEGLLDPNTVSLAHSQSLTGTEAGNDRSPAILGAAPQVQIFAARLQAKNPELLEELANASRIVN